MVISPLLPFSRLVSADSPLPAAVTAAAGATMLAVTQAGDNPVSSSVLAIIGTFLGATGIGGMAARKFMEDWGRRHEEMRKAAQEEREQDRADQREWVARFEKSRAEEREQRERERAYLLEVIEVWRKRCDAVEERHNQFIFQFIEKQTITTRRPEATP